MSRRDDVITATTSLETLIDRFGLEAVMDWTADICFEKAQHISDVWGDEFLAKLWKHAGTKISALAASDAIRDPSPRME